VRLSDVAPDEARRWSTGSAELDRVLGGGLVRGSFVLLGGDPGIGKSTLALQLASHLAELSVWYISGEESGAQLRQRADRLGVSASRILISHETDMLQLAETVNTDPPEVLIVDSIQTVFRSDLDPLPGSVTQIRESAAILQRIAKQQGITVIIIGHVTKDGDLAGPRVLEHMVDAVIQFEGDNQAMYRLLRTSKNRFGPSGEIGVFRMVEAGLEDVDQPSDIFLADYDPGSSGTALTVVLEGTRPLVIEVQALVTASTYSTPQRTATGIDQRRVQMLLAVLEQRVKIAFGQKDVFVNVVGGLKISDPSLDLAICMALVSAWMDQPLKKGSVYIGEVGLGGEVRAVPMLERRVNEAKRAGFGTVVVPGKRLSEIVKAI
jgi:DNA repair protein RadA/Sms